MTRTHLSNMTAGLIAVCACTASTAQQPEIERLDLSLTLAKAPIQITKVYPSVKLLPGLSMTATLPAPPSLTATCNAQSFLWRGPSGMPSCPSIPPAGHGSFASQPVFEQNGLPELSGYCTFTWTPSVQSAAPDLPHLRMALGNYGQLPDPVPDCPVVEPLADPDLRLTQALEEKLTQQSGPVPRSLQQGRVRVAIVDTAAVPYAATERDNYGHGRLMGRIVHRLGCSHDDASCPIQIDNHLAMPYLRLDQRDHVRGGFFGTRVDLARAIHRALLAWGNAELASGGTPKPLVINLSVGWDNLHGGSTITPSSPSHMVYLALERAACLGAITIVAAGNAAGDLRSGFMLPALWRDSDAPDSLRCAKITGVATDKPGLMRPRSAAAAGAKLLEAVAAVDFMDHPLATARDDATPRFAAYGQGAVVTDVRTDYTDVLSGSSVAAAVLSAAVASVWSVAPEKAPDAILRLIYHRAVPLGRPVEPCVAAECAEVRRVSVCEAARAACSGSVCDGLEACQTVLAFGGRSTLDGSSFAPGDYPAQATAACSAEHSCTPSGPGYSYAPWVGPQPGPQTCPYCAVSMRGTGFLTLSTPLQRASSLELLLDNGNGYQVTASRSGSFPERFSVHGLDTTAATSARLVAVIGDGREARVTETPLLLY